MGKSNANTQAVTASFWSEKAAAVSADSDRTAEDVTCIGFDGTAQDCLPVEYLSGHSTRCRRTAVRDFFDAGVDTVWQL